ncbi:hypothetical protein E2C01_005669 [Portunus trituberculatus]|uniref:Uncharacterized protein n=1 Tax=Portunus trituberculatus TaxID=210409 RepID=A0A5B7CTB4_PORTR|nr:hypothetical protein [Portunus trituberculatus]
MNYTTLLSHTFQQQQHGSVILGATPVVEVPRSLLNYQSVAPGLRPTTKNPTRCPSRLRIRSDAPPYGYQASLAVQVNNGEHKTDGIVHLTSSRMRLRRSPLLRQLCYYLVTLKEA